jgi:hypothetical protein
MLQTTLQQQPQQETPVVGNEKFVITTVSVSFNLFAPGERAPRHDPVAIKKLDMYLTASVVLAISSGQICVNENEGEAEISGRIVDSQSNGLLSPLFYVDGNLTTGREARTIKALQGQGWKFKESTLKRFCL